MKLTRTNLNGVQDVKGEKNV